MEANKGVVWRNTKLLNFFFPSYLFSFRKGKIGSGGAKNAFEALIVLGIDFEIPAFKVTDMLFYGRIRMEFLDLVYLVIRKPIINSFYKSGQFSTRLYKGEVAVTDL